MTGPRLAPEWHAALGPRPGPWAEALLLRLARARCFSLALEDLPWAPPGGVGVAHVPLPPRGVPGLGAGQALIQAVDALEGPVLAAPFALCVPRGGDPAMAAFSADAEEELLAEAAARGVSSAGGCSLGGDGLRAGLTLDAFALGLEGPPHGMAWDLLAGDALVPASRRACPEGTLGWVPTGGRPWWDVALSLARRAGLGLRTPLAGEAEGVAWVRGSFPGGSARVLESASVELVDEQGVLPLTMALLDHPPFLTVPQAAPAPRVGPPVDVAWLRQAARSEIARPPSPGLLHPWPGEAEVAVLPGGARALAWATGAATVTPEEDPFWRAARELAQVALRLACVGAEPLGVALAFHPSREPGGVEALEAAVLGLRQAGFALDLPVLQAGLQAEAEPALGLALLGVGVLEDPAPPLDVTAPDATALTHLGHRTAPAAFRAGGDGLVVLGEPTGDLDACYRLAACVREGVRLGLFRSAQVVGAHGLLGAAVAGARAGALGCHLLLAGGDPALGSCLPGCVLVSLSVAGESGLEALATAHGVPFRKVGATGGTRVSLALDGRPVLDLGLDGD